jgi:dynein heavy chain 1, cytosolic
MRSYQIYEVYTNHLKNYKKFNELLMDLRNDAMKPKHWKDLLGKLHINIKLQDILLGDLWNADLLGKQKVV